MTEETYEYADSVFSESSSEPSFELSENTLISNVELNEGNTYKLLEVKEMNDFFDEVHKSKCEKSGINQSPIRHQSETSLRNHDKNESNTKTVNIVHDQEKISLKDSVQKMPKRLNEDVSQRESDSGLVTEIHSNSSSIIEELACLFHQTSITRKNSIKAKQEEILSWGRYSEKFEDKVMKLRSKNKNLKDKIARSQIYNEMKPYLSGVSDEYLRKITSKTRKINKLFGYDYDPITLKKIKNQMNLNVTNKTMNNVHDQSHVTSEMITSDTTAPIPLLSIGHITSEKIVNASQTIPAKVPAFFQPNASPEMISSDMFQA
ncbi:hypothetical protein C1646_755988, partial [Rhizophagus diaphanus]